MRMDGLAAAALEPVRDGRLAIKPEGQRRRYVEWLENIRPWCISRQLWWGHQIPVWYRGDEIHVGTEAPEGDGWERDPDVLDTWFSSQLWPFATLGWPHGTRHPLPVGGADGDDGARVHRRGPVLARERAHGHPGARRPPDVQVARHG